MAPENGSDTEVIARDWVKRFSSFSEWQGGSKDVPQAGEVVVCLFSPNTKEIILSSNGGTSSGDKAHSANTLSLLDSC